MVGFTLFFHVLPYIEEGSLWDQMDLTMGNYDDENVGLRQQDIATYSCPSDETTGWKIKPFAAWPPFSLGNMAFACSVDGFRNDNGPYPFLSYDSPTDRRPTFYFDSETTFRDMEDGTSKVVILSEMIVGIKENSLEVDTDVDIRGLWSDSFGCSFSGMYSPNGTRRTSSNMRSRAP